MSKGVRFSVVPRFYSFFFSFLFLLLYLVSTGHLFFVRSRQLGQLGFCVLKAETELKQLMNDGVRDAFVLVNPN